MYENDLLTNFLMSFKQELRKIFGDIETEEEWVSIASTRGWLNALKIASEKEMPEILELYYRLNWWASDLFDDWLLNCAKEINLYKS